MIDLQSAAVQQALLGRRVHHVLTDTDRAAIAGARILITGAAGSIGSELARQLASCGPESLTLFDHGEYGLFRLERELVEGGPACRLDPVLGDVTRVRSLRHACRSAQPEVVYHAAAYKHVTMAERAACAAIETNVLGSFHAARVARDAGARFVLISSDKAAQPCSVMGATKRLAELAVLSLSRGPFRPIVVRFGNVLGSSGSVLELFLDRLAKGLPIELTHPDATRFMMTASEAASLVIKADLLRAGGQIHWLDMGQPVRLLHLLQRTMALAAEAGHAPVPVKVIGLRPGEKLHEDLTSQGLSLTRTVHPRIFVARQAPANRVVVRRVLRALRDDVARGDAMEALRDLCAGVPEFQPSAHARLCATAASIFGPASSWCCEMGKTA